MSDSLTEATGFTTPGFLDGMKSNSEESEGVSDGSPLENAKPAQKKARAKRSLGPEDGPKAYSRCLNIVRSISPHWRRFVCEQLAAYSEACDSAPSANGDSSNES